MVSFIAACDGLPSLFFVMEAQKSDRRKLRPHSTPARFWRRHNAALLSRSAMRMLSQGDTAPCLSHPFSPFMRCIFLQLQGPGDGVLGASISWRCPRRC